MMMMMRRRRRRMPGTAGCQEAVRVMVKNTRSGRGCPSPNPMSTIY